VLEEASMARLLTHHGAIAFGAYDVGAAGASNVRRQLLIYCETEEDPLTGRTDLYKIRLLSPDPALLNPDQTELDSGTPLGNNFVVNFLANTTSIRGNPFRRVVSSQVIEF